MPKITGLEETIKALEKFGEEGKKVIDGTINAVAELMVDKAQNELKAFDTGKLYQSIQTVKVEEMEYIVEAGQGAPYAPYIEYGTGGKVQVPKEFAQQAALAKGNNIRYIELPARPFMYPAFTYGQKIIQKELENSLESLIKKMK